MRINSFNPFSFRSPSKRLLNGFFEQPTVSIPSPSGLLQNFGRQRMSEVKCVSIPSPSGLLQNRYEVGCCSLGLFQSLLLQVSFKTSTTLTTVPGTVSIPSPSGLLQNLRQHHVAYHERFNPFSFRSPSKRCNQLEPPPLAAFQSLLLQVSFKTGNRLN